MVYEDAILRGNKAYTRSRDYGHHDGVHSFIKRNTRTRYMAQWVNVQALYLIPQAYMVEGENEPHKIFL